MTKNYITNFWLVLLIHILLLLFISTRISFLPDQLDQKVPHRVERSTPNYVPSYFYTPPKQQYTPMTQETTIPAATTKQLSEKPLPESHHGIEKSRPTKQTSILAMSQSSIRHDFIKSALDHTSTEEPILLIGDESNSVNPLVRLLGRSLSAHFQYPHVEGTFGVTGKVYIRLTLHPEGFYSDVHIVKSSDNEDFDRAALYAVNAAPNVVGVDKLLKQPTEFLVGFIFN